MGGGLGFRGFSWGGGGVCWGFGGWGGAAGRGGGGEKTGGGEEKNFAHFVVFSPGPFFSQRSIARCKFQNEKRPRKTSSWAIASKGRRRKDPDAGQYR